jgi:hypothetical protein
MSIMSEYRVNIETFRITNGEVPKLTVERGFATDSPGASARYIVPPRIKLDVSDRPEINEAGDVTEFSADATIMATSWYELSRLSAYAPAELVVGRAALILLKEIDSRAYHTDRAIQWDAEQSAREVMSYHKHRDEGDPEIRSSLIMLSDSGKISLSDFTAAGNWITRTITYDPYSQEGLIIDPGLEPDESEEPDDSDEGGSDREPRNPLIPQASGEAEAEIPECEDNSPPYKNVIS